VCEREWGNVRRGGEIVSQGVDVEGLSSFLEVDMELLLCLDVEKKVKEPVYNKMNDNFDETSMTAPLLL
jgi:hypothetical protein